MDKDIAKRWMSALLSGDYKQTRNRLRDGEAHCAIGVLCDLAVKDGVGYWDACEYYVSPDSKVECFELPKSVKNWAGLKTYAEHIQELNDGNMSQSIEGKSFKEVASYINKNVKGI